MPSSRCLASLSLTSCPQSLFAGVRIALAFFGVPYKCVPINLLKGEQAGVSEMQQVPRLDWKDLAGAEHSLTQSIAIIELLCEVCGGGRASLLPVDPVMRAHARQIAEIINSGTHPLQNLSHIKTIQGELSKDVIDARAIGKAAIIKGLAAVEKQVERVQTHPGFAVGASLTVADVAILPQLYNARRFEVDVQQFPKLLAIEAHASTLPCCKAAHPDTQPDAAK
jgi:maleylacetoacetate isomerase